MRFARAASIPAVSILRRLALRSMIVAALDTGMRRGEMPLRFKDAGLRGQRSAASRSEVALGKGPAGPGLQVLLEASGFPLRRELDDNGHRPWSVLDRVATGAVVVPLHAPIDVAGDADVVTLRIAVAAKDVDEASADSAHTGLPSTARARS